MYNIKLLFKHLANAYVFGFMFLAFANINMVYSVNIVCNTHIKLDEPPPIG